MIATMNDLAELWGLPRDTPKHRLDKALFKGTTCGAWFVFEETHLLLGSIVEGADIDCTTHKLKLPTTSDDVENALSQIEEEADQIWTDWNYYEEEGEHPFSKMGEDFSEPRGGE